ncbi:MAG: radical SAM protein, partial [Candidatus Omnitrophica bacterium]|nr:radical SAM protein [Candidatus Omnitrophota bacterium]
KIIPGASDGAIRQSLALASAVSLNIEAPGGGHFKSLSTTKDYWRDVLRPIQLIGKLTAKGSPYAGVKQTTQFVVGASHETDREIIRCSWKLYRDVGLARVYFSAYQRGAGAPELPGERSAASPHDLLAREHRLYQADWLMRKYGFSAEEIPLEPGGNLSLSVDPKEMWARQHPEFFPVNVNRDGPGRLLRVPGLGQIMVERILASRTAGIRVRSLADVGRRTKVLAKAEPYVTF